MIGLDTNALVRDIMQDDPQPSSKATRLGESLTSEAPGVVPLVAVVDLLRVPSSSHRLSRDQLVDTLDLLLRSKEILVDRAKLVLHAQRDFANGGNERLPGDDDARCRRAERDRYDARDLITAPCPGGRRQAQQVATFLHAGEACPSRMPSSAA
ncbi:MAG: hypothetical protein MUE62_06205 [Burkholderiaceae bacterium]|nr:hypothetical protein [Burkholderiaceae bacterium]